MHTQFENIQARQGQSKKSNDFNSTASKHSQVLVKAQLEMTTPGDSDEQEADEMANSIVSEGRIARSVSAGHSGGGVALPSQFASRISSFQGQGSRIAGDLKTKMENGFGRDFSNVRLHTDNAAAEMSSSISAKAFTYGSDIFFNRGQYNPETNEGQHLIAHELTHVVQGGQRLARDNNSSMNNRGDLYSSYIKQPDYALTEENQRKMQSFFSDDSERFPLTIVLFTDSAKGGDPFELDIPINNFIQTEDRTKVMMLQGLSTIQDYLDAINQLVLIYGPLQNLIIMGHGRDDRVSLGENARLDTSNNSKFFYTRINELFKSADEENKSRLRHSILLPVCLTGANYDSPRGLVNHIQLHMEGDVLVRGNKASVGNKQKYLYSDNQPNSTSSGGYLTFEEENDKTSPINGRYETPATKPSDEVYSGTEISGIMYRIKNHLEQQLRERDTRAFSSLKLSEEASGSDVRVDFIYNSQKLFKYFSPHSVYQIIKDNIDYDQEAVLSFIDYILYSYIPMNRRHPRLSDLFRGAKRHPIYKKYYYTYDKD